MISLDERKIVIPKIDLIKILRALCVHRSLIEAKHLVDFFETVVPQQCTGSTLLALYTYSDLVATIQVRIDSDHKITLTANAFHVIRGFASLP
jgi:hypothetical protein